MSTTGDVDGWQWMWKLMRGERTGQKNPSLDARCLVDSNKSVIFSTGDDVPCLRRPRFFYSIENGEVTILDHFTAYLTALFGDPEELEKSQLALTKMLVPFVEHYDAAVRHLAKELEPIVRISQSEEYGATLRDLVNKLRPYAAGDSIKDCRLGDQTSGAEQRFVKPKRILGFLGGSRMMSACQ